MVKFDSLRDSNPAIVHNKHYTQCYGMPAFSLIEFRTKIHKVCETVNIDFARNIPQKKHFLCTHSENGHVIAHIFHATTSTQQ